MKFDKCFKIYQVLTNKKEKPKKNFIELKF